MSEEKVSKQVIVMRKDLNMRKGKMIAQGAHASMAAVIQLAEVTGEDGNSVFRTFDIELGSALDDWLNGSFTKICLSVNSEEELHKVYAEAHNKGLICSLIKDAGRTEFGGVPTYTCCAIGPAWADEIDPITGHLSLL